MSLIPLTFDNLVKVNNSEFMYNHGDSQSTDSVATDSTSSTIKLPTISTVGKKEEVVKATSPNASTTSLNLPYPLIRKKTGELVKSSLRLSALGRSASSPQLIPNKSVRFASRLANVRMFDGTDSPSTVSTADNTPMGSPIPSNDRKPRTSYFEWNSEDEEDASDITSDEDSASSTPNKYAIESSDVKRAYSFNKANLPIYLQSLELNTSKDELVGFVVVENLAFEKHISVKFTLNGWKSSMTLNNVKFFNSLSNCNSDRFRFTLPLHGLSNYLNIELVLKYEVNGATYWDNNNSSNYKIKLKPFVSGSQNANSLFGREDSKFDELVSRLSNYKYSSFADVDDQEYLLSRPRPLSPTKGKSEFHKRYNFGQELDADPFIAKEKPASFVASTLRPPLKQSLSTSDIITVKPKYSQSYKSKQQKETSKNNAPTFTQTTFNSKSYSDLLLTYCFYNGEKSKKLESLCTTSAYISSPASTFHSLSDSIHI